MSSDPRGQLLTGEVVLPTVSHMPHKPSATGGFSVFFHNYGFTKSHKSSVLTAKPKRAHTALASPCFTLNLVVPQHNWLHDHRRGGAHAVGPRHNLAELRLVVERVDDEDVRDE